MFNLRPEVTHLDGGTDLLAVHEGLPAGVPLADNEAGWREALAKLAALVEDEFKKGRLGA